MKKIRYLLWVICGLTTLASCNGDCEIPMPADNAIRFDNRIGEPYVEDLTKGMVTDGNNLTEFGVFAYYSAPDLSYTNSSKPDYMDNVHVTRPQGVWNYTPQMFWPKGSVSFFAYTPYIGTNNNVSVECKTGAPVVTYTVPDDVKAHCDLMLSAPALNLTNVDGKATLKFNHALACIDFNARVSGTLTETQSIKVIAIKLGKFLNTASCHHELADAITQSFVGAIDKESNLSVTEQTLQDLFLTDKYQQITSANSCPMLWPQQIDADDKLTITTEYTSNGKTRTIVFEPLIQGFVPKIEAGKRYIFNLMFSKFENVTLTCSVVGWTEKKFEVPEFN